MVALAEFHTELLAPQNEVAAGHSDHLLTTIHGASRSPEVGLIAGGPHLDPVRPGRTLHKVAFVNPCILMTLKLKSSVLSFCSKL